MKAILSAEKSDSSGAYLLIVYKFPSAHPALMQMWLAGLGPSAWPLLSIVAAEHSKGLDWGAEGEGISGPLSLPEQEERRKVATGLNEHTLSCQHGNSLRVENCLWPFTCN